MRATSLGKLSGFTVLLLVVPLSCAKEAAHDHPDPAAPHHPGDHAAAHDHGSSSAPVPKSYAEAVRQMRLLLASLDATIKSGQYDNVHHDSQALRRICGSIKELATAQSSPVPKDKVNEVTELASQLSSATDDFHDAAHDGDLQRLKERYAQMVKLVDSLARYADAS
jgi:hypothetical protein